MMDLGLRCSYFSPSLEWTAEYWQVGKRRWERGFTDERAEDEGDYSR